MSAFNVNGSYPTDSLYFAIGLDDNNIGTNGITDEAIVHIIYPGAQGPAGPQGPQGPTGATGATGKTVRVSV